jgi:hypothetical protein
MLQGGGMLVHVVGRFQMGGSGPLALGPPGAGPPSAFSESFVIKRDAHGQPTISNQIFRLL